MPVEKLLRTPLAGLDKVMVTVSDCETFTSANPNAGLLLVAKGLMPELSLTCWLATAPVIVIGKASAVQMTVLVVLLTVALALSVSVIVNVVVTVDLGATWCTVGLKLKSSMALVTSEAVPVTVKVPLVEL